MALNYKSNVELIDQSISYMNDLVVDHADEFARRKSEFIDTTKIEDMLASLKVPSTGKICEAGVWDHDVYNKLKKHFGADRCIGFDIYDYLDTPDESVIIGDFRSIHSKHNQDIAFFWNGLGGWDTNPTSKQAGLDYAYNNLVSGGYYVDLTFFVGHPGLDKYPNFTEVNYDDIFRIYRMK